jgi:predicted acylesterase/phospholipase RssA
MRPEDITYLAFEGGGGKGYAYLGALKVLQEAKILERVRGYAGASAGGITAFLLSIGYDVKELEVFLALDFDVFWEAPRYKNTPRLMPRVGRDYESIDDSRQETSLTSAFAVLQLATAWFFTSVLPIVVPFKQKQPFATLIAEFPRLLAYWGRDMGLFSGNAPREMFGSALGAKTEKKRKELQDQGTPIPDSLQRFNKFLTFKQHKEIFETILVLTGTNLSTGRTEVFSATATPNFPVIDAVRITMGLPFIFKPYVIDKATAGWPPCGVYVDGGLWNNAPFREFEGEGLGSLFTPRTGAPPGPLAVEKTLLMRLEVNPSDKVESLVDLLRVTAKNGVFGCGESQVNRRYASQAIILDTEGLSLVDFNPPKDVKVRVEKRAKRWTRAYFNLPADSADADKADDDATISRRAAKQAIY